MSVLIFLDEAVLAFALSFFTISMNEKISTTNTGLQPINYGMVILGSFIQLIVVTACFVFLRMLSISDFNWSLFAVMLIISIIICKVVSISRLMKSSD